VPATSEGVVRVVLPFAQSGQTVAVIGGKGFVGKGVVDLLSKKGIKVGVFEQGDDLEQVKAYDIVVSAVGKPRVVKSAHLKPEHILVVDTGFIPETEREGKLAVIGDVEESAREIPQHITPVPGGTGPVEMAALMERAATLLGVKVRSWEVELRDGKLRAVFRE
jgi:methylenetetrahydrofolate dehydrogenase (NADP+)/methenyltetrahydrofolate cyclohydrolase